MCGGCGGGVGEVRMRLNELTMMARQRKVSFISKLIRNPPFFDNILQKIQQFLIFFFKR